MDRLLEIRELSKFYGKEAALRDVSLIIPSGKIVGLLGPNGSGKTTLIKIIMGLLQDYTGEVRIAGYEPGFQANANISYLPDVSHIPTWFTVDQSLAFFRDFYADFDSSRASNMLETMKIPSKKKIKNLSKGMQEKVNLSLIMGRRAILYLLDEPIGAVDPASREFIIDTILRHLPEGSSILLSTHIITDIEQILDVAIFLKNGSIVICDEAEKIREERQLSLDQLFREVFRNVY